MSVCSDDFFTGKRPWSLIKDRVLGSYLPPYLAKVKQLGRPILLIDGYAGPGVFEDGSIGSPLIMCEAAEKHVCGRYQAIFVNREAAYHQRLQMALRERGWEGAAQAVHGDSTDLLCRLPSYFGTHTVFIYLDPFGLRGCEFSLLEPLLKRDQRFSTEILLTLSMPIVHRLASRHAVRAGRGAEPLIASYHRMLTRLFGGDYWQASMLSEHGNGEAKEHELIEAYRARLAAYLPSTGCCPVRESADRRIKYFIVFASRHPDAMLLLNDIMVASYHEHMHRAAWAGTLFADSDWREHRAFPDIEQSILGAVINRAGGSRVQIWTDIVQSHFMRYTHREFLAALERLDRLGQIIYATDPRTKRRNERSAIRLLTTPPLGLA